MKLVSRDDSHPHQIRLIWVKGSDGVPRCAVSCTCREQKTHGSYEPMDLVEQGASPWPIFNDHTNHHPLPRLFTEDDQGGPYETRLPISTEASK